MNLTGVSFSVVTIQLEAAVWHEHKKNVAFDPHPGLKFSSFTLRVNLHTALTVNALEKEAMHAFRGAGRCNHLV